MANLNKLKSLIELVGGQENYSCNVFIESVIDSNAQSELRKIRDALSVEERAVIERILCEQLKCPPIDRNENQPKNWTFATHVFGVLLQIRHELDQHDDFPVTVNEAKKIHIGIRKSIEYGLKPYILGITNAAEKCIPYIVGSMNVLLKISSNKYFPIICTRSDQHLLYTDLLSSVFVVLCTADDDTKSIFQAHLTNIKSKLSPADYFKILFLIKGNNKHQSAILIQQIVHKQLLETLYQPGSFIAVSEALLPSITSLDQDEEILKKRMHCCSVISSIVGCRGHKKKFYHQIIDEIHQHLLKYISNNRTNQQFYVDVGVQCLNKLHSLELSFIQRHIYDISLGFFDRLALPTDLLTGAIICEHSEFIDAINLVHLAFCASGPSDDTLPSDLLTPFMPLFCQIHHAVSDSTDNKLKNDLLAIIVRCFSNREKIELNKVVECILYEEYESGMKHLHPRIRINRTVDGENEKFTFKIVSVESNDNPSSSDIDISSFLRSSTTLVNVLKQSNHNILTYNVFLHLLKLFSDQFSQATIDNAQQMQSSELLDTEVELSKAIERNFKRKYAIVHALNELILFKSFHGQFTENPHDVMNMLDNMLVHQIDRIEAAQKSHQTSSEDSQEILIVILSIVGDFLPRIHNDLLKMKLLKTLKRLRLLLVGDQWKTVLRKLDLMLDSPTKDDSSSEFSIAKAILSETHHEPYTKVYAVMNMMKLINKRDEETLLNAHTVLALAVRLLKEEDSYIFLNCIKLLIALVAILEDTVLETLVAEYHFNIDTEAAEIDFKLKIGETILKVTQGLGEMCYKYKTMLINCFLRGSFHSNDEFRTSNISNLGVIMRILSYQVHHFFQEVMTLIQNTLQFDKYLPSRRAAALVLTDLLNGMQSLEQYQNYLLPIYRTLKYISENDPDLHMQIHAGNGLKCLRDKIKDAFTQEQALEKEIKIFGVKSEEKRILFK